MKKTKHDGEIRRFIKHFDGAQDVFINGCCYWFARILNGRFSAMLANDMHVGYILYEPVEGHFLFGVADVRELHGDDRAFEYYDIRGNVTRLYKGKELYTIRRMIDEMPDYYDHLMRNCRDFEDDED